MCASKSGTKPPRTSVAVVKQRVTGSKISSTEDDFLAIEDPLEISVNSAGRNGKRATRVLTVTMRTPGHDQEMITGFFLAEGIITSAQDIEAIELDPPDGDAAPTRAVVRLREHVQFSASQRNRNFAVHSACGVCGSTSLSQLKIPISLVLNDTTRVDRAWIHQLPELMRAAQPTFHKTGGLHAAAIFSSAKELLAVREDIGRHNALDKAIGACLIAGQIPTQGHILCVSGRMSYEILQKALAARIAIIAGIGAPSSYAVALANDFNATLLGFVREKSYNIYSCPERIR